MANRTITVEITFPVRDTMRAAEADCLLDIIKRELRTGDLAGRMKDASFSYDMDDEPQGPQPLVAIDRSNTVRVWDDAWRRVRDATPPPLTAWNLADAFAAAKASIAAHPDQNREAVWMDVPDALTPVFTQSWKDELEAYLQSPEEPDTSIDDSARWYLTDKDQKPISIGTFDVQRIAQDYASHLKATGQDISPWLKLALTWWGVDFDQVYRNAEPARNPNITEDLYQRAEYASTHFAPDGWRPQEPVISAKQAAEIGKEIAASIIGKDLTKAIEDTPVGGTFTGPIWPRYTSPQFLPPSKPDNTCPKCGANDGHVPGGVMCRG